jgi:GT2 family glycosyltransferase
VPDARARELRLALFGSAAAIGRVAEALRRQLPAATALVAPDAHDAREAGFDTWQAAVAAAARASPAGQLILVDADRVGAGLLLPELACERLARALAEPGVLVASPLDARERRVFAADDAAGRTPAELDRLCYAWSARALINDAAWPLQPPPLSAWHGERLAALATVPVDDVDAWDAAGLRAVLLDHLYLALPPETGRPVASEVADPRDPGPPSPLARLRERLRPAVCSPGLPGCPGLDARPVLLHVLHGWGGGAQRWVHDYAAADATAHHLLLIARGSLARRRHGEWLELADARLPGVPLRRIPLPRPIADTAVTDAACRAILAALIDEYRVDAVLASSLIGHSLDVLRTGLPTVRIVHDHYPFWPLLHRDFGDAGLAFDDAQRAADLAGAAPDFEFSNRDPRHWQALATATVDALLDAQATLVAPSHSALANELRLAPALGTLAHEVIPHGFAWPADVAALAPPPRRQRLRLVMCGRVRGGKGMEILRAALPGLVAHAELFLLGAGSDAQALFGRTGVHILLDYDPAELPGLLARLAPDAALLLPSVAETFSYTLSELRALGIAVIATRVGALAERIDDGIDGFLAEPDAAAVVTRVAALAADPAPLAAVRARLAGQREATPAEMAARHAAVLALAPRAPLRYPLVAPGLANLEANTAAAALAAARRREASLRDDVAALDAENARRGEWGHALDRELAAVRGELDERTRWAQSLEAKLDELRNSLFWRVTRPLRWLRRRWKTRHTDGMPGAARLRALATALAFRGKRASALLRRLRGSLAQRGLQGTLQRIRQEFRRGGVAGAPARYGLPRDDATPFALPSSDTPRVSIIMPVFGKVAYTIACLRSIAAHPGTVPFEVVVVDDASTDATPARLAEVAGIKLLRNAVNLGFVGTCNAGAAAARGEYLAFLNNDTLVTGSWLEALLRCFDEEPDCGLAGARLVYPDGRLQEAGGIVFADGSGWNYGRFEDPRDPRFAFRREADYCSGAAIVLRRSLFEALGGFDARYAPAYYEDTDLAFAVRAAGFKVYYEPAATVVHFEGITAGTDTGSGIKRHQALNQQTFREKWSAVLAAHPAPGTPIARAATWRAKRRILIIDATTPTPDMDSGSLRMTNLMRILHRRGAQVSFLPDNRAWVDCYTPALQALGVEALHAPFVTDPVALFRQRGSEFDAIVLSRHYVATGYVGLARLHAPGALLVFDTVDLHYLREERGAGLDGNAALERRAAATRAQELKLMRECDVTLVVSPVEQALLARDAPGVRVEVLSNVHAVHGCRRPFGDRRDLVFVGGFQHPPNIDAVTWLVHEVLPGLDPALAEARVHIIGSRVTPEVEALAGGRVLIHGHVPDIEPYMDGCRIALAPLRYGAGVKGKVNLAMSYGLPVVATPCAVEGMHVADGTDVLVAADAREFAECIARLYRDAALWQRLSANGLDNVRRHFSFEAAGAVVGRVFGV